MTVKPPRPKGPPLNSLRAFEAAARHCSFVLAAEELCVTPGAIAQHIKALEAWSKADLFERQSQGVKLTPLGLSILSDFSHAFDQLGEAIQKLRSQAAPKDIRIAALPSIAQLWVSPRLPEIRRQMPDVTISLTAMERPPNLKRDPFDLGIFFEDTGKILPSEQIALPVCEDSIFPVCAPSVAQNVRSLTELSQQTLLHDSTWADDWNNWLRHISNKPESQPQKGKFNPENSGPVFSLYSLALEEAKNGAGVLMGHEPLVRHLLNTGELVQPFQETLGNNSTLYIAMTPSAQENPTIQKAINILTL